MVKMSQYNKVLLIVKYYRRQLLFIIKQKVVTFYTRAMQHCRFVTFVRLSVRGVYIRY